jgi:hypothetical protein
MAMHNESNNFVKLACGRLASVFAAVGKRLVAWPAERCACFGNTGPLSVLGGRPFERARGQSYFVWLLSVILSPNCSQSIKYYLINWTSTLCATTAGGGREISGQLSTNFCFPLHADGLQPAPAVNEIDGISWAR